MNLLPQDVLILLKLTVSQKLKATWSLQNLGHELGLSSSMVHAGLKRATQARLYDPDQRKPIKRALEELLIHAVKYVFVPDLGPPTRGIPTAHAAPALHNDFAYKEESAYVWPDANGYANGIELSPLSKSAPHAAMMDEDLYNALALLDAIRIGRSRERKMAEDKLLCLVRACV